MQTIRQEVEEIASKMCDEYCKYPQIAHEDWLRGLLEDGDDETEYLTTRYCKGCPILRLV